MKNVSASAEKSFLQLALQHAVSCCILICTLLVTCPSFIHAQCTPLAQAIPGITLTPCPNGTENRSGLAYNPIFNIYYSVDAGNSNYPIQTYSSSGILLDSRAAGFDYRGLWWNPSKSQLEGNGYDGLGLSIQKLDSANGYPRGKVKSYPGSFQPDVQSCGAYDYNENVVYYYNQGKIYVYNRKNGTLLRTRKLKNIPVSINQINSTSVVYTGCTGMEIGILDYANQRVYLFSAPDGNFAASIQLPLNISPHDRFAMAYTNNLFWLFDNDSWYSYQLFADASKPAAQKSNSIAAEKDIMSEGARDYTYDKNTKVNTTAMPPAANEPAMIVNQSAVANNNATVSITPNPVKNSLQLHLQSTSNGKAVIQIINFTGKIVINELTVLKQGNNHVPINVYTLAPGTYILKVLAQGKMENIKFIKE